MRSKKSFPCNLKALGSMRIFLTGFCRKHGIDPIRLSEIELAVNEACTNVIEHGNVSAKDMMTLTLEKTDGVLYATLHDNGRPYDLDSAKTVKSGAEIGRTRPRSGMGVYIIRRLVDGVLYNRLADGRNELKLIKKF